MENDILVYVKRDSLGSIVEIRSNVFLEDTTEYEQIDTWQEGEDRYMFAHADNGEYILEKHGKNLFDENRKPNFKGAFVELTDEEKEQHYPTPAPQPAFEELQNDFNIDTDFRISMLELGI